MSYYFKSEKCPNCKIEFDKKGVVLSVSLNITHAMKKHLYAAHVFEGGEMLVYVLKKRVVHPNAKTMTEAYNLLMNNLKVNCRLAKVNVLNDEIIKINS